MELIVSSVSAPHHAAIVKEKFKLRQIILKGNNLIREAQEERDSNDILNTFSSQIINIQENRKEIDPTEELHKLNDFIESRKNSTKISGIASGIYELDRMTCGWQPGELIIIAGRPATGKTSFAINCILNCLREGINVGFISYEMKTKDIMLRMVAQEAKVNGLNLKNGTILYNSNERDKYIKGLAVVSGLIKTPKLSMDESCKTFISVRAKTQMWKIKNNIKLLCIDYLGLMDFDKKMNLSDAIGEVTKNLKAIAMSFNIPVLLLAQLNRLSENEGSVVRRPRLSDLRSSGNIEQDADTVLFTYHKGEIGNEESFLILGKQRNGPVGEIPVRYVRESALFQNLAERQQDNRDPYFE
jgi:replicative DNA helicase